MSKWKKLAIDLAYPVGVITASLAAYCVKNLMDRERDRQKENNILQRKSQERAWRQEDRIKQQQEKNADQPIQSNQPTHNSTSGNDISKKDDGGSSSTYNSPFDSFDFAFFFSTPILILISSFSLYFLSLSSLFLNLHEFLLTKFLPSSTILKISSS